MLVLLKDGVEYDYDEMWQHLLPLMEFAKANDILYPRGGDRKNQTVFHFMEIIQHLNEYEDSGNNDYRIVATLLDNHGMSLRFQRLKNECWVTETSSCLEFVGWLTHSGKKRPANEVGWFISS